MKFCPECGNGIEGMKFCPECGYRVEEAEPQAPAGAPVEQPMPEVDVNATSMAPVYEFTSHVAGKNAKVFIYTDRIEWYKEGSKVARATVATMTMGVSLLAGKKKESEMIPMKSITHVSTKRDGLVNTKVVVTTSGGNVEFRVSHSEADIVKNHILKCVL